MQPKGWGELVVRRRGIFLLSDLCGGSKHARGDKKVEIIGGKGFLAARGEEGSLSFRPGCLGATRFRSDWEDPAALESKEGVNPK